MADYRKIRPVQRKSWLQSFPEEIYNLADTSHIARLAEALCGDPGVGAARKTLMVKRLQTALPEVRFTDLDLVYNGIFDFPRLEREKYSYQITDLLTAEQREEISLKDASYRRRIARFMKAFQYGASRMGMELIAESVFDCDCEVVSAIDYAISVGLAQGDVSAQHIGENEDGLIDEREFVIIVMTDDDLTDEQTYLCHKMLYRLMPVDSVVSVKTRKEIFAITGAQDLSVIDMDYKIVDVSSEYWAVKKMVTGRMDWDYAKYPHLWVEPGVAKEAPTQPLVYSQEEAFDITHMIKDVKASSEHIGAYGHEQQLLYPELALDSASELTPASNVLASASAKRYIASYYGDDPTVDWSYPIEYTPELQSYFDEKARHIRFWSSDEKLDGSEELEFELSRAVPISCIKLDISKKPVRITPYVSSAYKNGKRVWHQVQSRDGIKMSYTSRRWGGSSIGGDFDSVEFSFATIKADAIKVVFERLDQPFYETIGDQTYIEKRFPYSFEVSNFMALFEIRYKHDYVDATYEDIFGNRVDTSLVVSHARYLTDGDDASYWMSQPNIDESAIEYLVLDVRKDGKAVKMNRLDIDIVYGGCQLNVYSTEGDEPGNWKPYPDSYDLDGSPIFLTARNVSFLKLEFTRLNAIPYTNAFDDIVVKSLVFPDELMKRLNEKFSQTFELDDVQKLLYVNEDAAYSQADVYGNNGVQDVYADIVANTVSPLVAESQQLQSGGPIYSDQFRRLQDSAIRGTYGYDAAIEKPLKFPDVISSYEPRVDYKFFEEGQHEYKIRWDERSYDLAYVVGIRGIKVGLDAHIFSPGYANAFSMPAYDSRFFETVDGWELTHDERLCVSTDEYMCTLETGDIHTVMPFRTFDFAVNQNPPRNMFDYPSDMMREWHGLNTTIKSVDFGVSGKTIEAQIQKGISGVESEPKLMRSLGIATYQIDVFDRSGGEWILEIRDLFGEQTSTRRYEIEPAKWNTLGITFSPQPGGSWWNQDYKFRMRIPMVGPISKGQAIFLPVIDFDALLATGDILEGLYPDPDLFPDSDLFPLPNRSKGVVRDDFKDIRIVYYNGIEANELDVDITDNMEWWFRAQGNVQKDSPADGSFHYDENTFVGAYYIYFGYESQEGDIDEPPRDYTKVFNNGHCVSQNVETRPSGTMFLEEDCAFDVDDYTLSGDNGFFSMEFTPTGDMLELPDGSIGIADVRFLLDYDDGSKRVQLYTYEKELTFVIEEDGYESAFVSRRTDLFENGKKSLILVQWGGRGSAEVTKNEVLEAADLSSGEIEQLIEDGKLPEGTIYAKSLVELQSVDKSITNRRAIRVYVDSPEPLECIPNVYDEKRYNEGAY